MDNVKRHIKPKNCRIRQFIITFKVIWGYVTFGVGTALLYKHPSFKDLLQIINTYFPRQYLLKSRPTNYEVPHHVIF